jgi:hypothetical protein
VSRSVRPPDYRTPEPAKEPQCAKPKNAGDPFGEFIQGLVDAVLGVREYTQADYELVGPGKGSCS